MSHRWVVGIWVVGIVAVAGGGPALSWLFWEDLRGGQVRNAALVIGGATALLLAVWRSRVAERQAKAAQSQVKASQQSLSNERYQKGAEMLGSDVRSVRLGVSPSKVVPSGPPWRLGGVEATSAKEGSG